MKEERACGGLGGSWEALAEALAEALEVHTNIEVVDLDRNQIGDEGAAAIGHALIANPDASSPATRGRSAAASDGLCGGQRP